MLRFTKVLKKLEDFTLPSGDAMLEKWIEAIRTANELLKANDMEGLSKVARGTLPVLRTLLLSIPDKTVNASIESLLNKFQQKYEKPLNTGTATIAEIDAVFKFGSRAMLSAMSKTTPTLKTMN